MSDKAPPVPTTIKEVIDVLGGTAKAAEALGTDISTISTWRKRRLPPGRFFEIAEVAKARGRPDVTMEVLAQIPAAEVGA